MNNTHNNASRSLKTDLQRVLSHTSLRSPKFVNAKMNGMKCLFSLLYVVKYPGGALKHAKVVCEFRSQCKQGFSTLLSNIVGDYLARDEEAVESMRKGAILSGEVVVNGKYASIRPLREVTREEARTEVPRSRLADGVHYSYVIPCLRPGETMVDYVNSLNITSEELTSLGYGRASMAAEKHGLGGLNIAPDGGFYLPTLDQWLLLKNGGLDEEALFLSVLSNGPMRYF